MGWPASSAGTTSSAGAFERKQPKPPQAGPVSPRAGRVIWPRARRVLPVASEAGRAAWRLMKLIIATKPSSQLHLEASRLAARTSLEADFIEC